MPVSFTPPGLPLGMPASVFAVVRYYRDATGDDRFEPLPNIAVESIHVQEGPTVPSAQFRYLLDDADPTSPVPYLVEELWPIGAEGRYVVRQDDELLVYCYQPDGTRLLVFDGFAQIPQADIGGGTATTFAATGVGIRLWDTVVGGAYYRDSTDPQAGDPVETSLPTWFNPWLNRNGRAQSWPNRTPTGYAVDDGTDTEQHLFLDHLLPTPSGASPTYPDYWTLSDFVKYVSRVTNPDETYVVNAVSATGAPLDDYLVSVRPLDGQQYMDLTDPSTYETSPIIIRSYDATGKPPVEAIAEQLMYYGFHIFFNLREEDDGSPTNELLIFRVDGRDAVAPKQLYYPANRASIADGLFDFHAMGLARDQTDGVNEYEVESVETEYEVSVVLAPGFEISAGDASTISTYNKSNLWNATAANRAKYRKFVFDEVGLGHWSFSGGGSWVTGTATSLDSVLGAPDENGVPQYVKRFRPGKNTVFYLDGDGNPRKAELAISRDYAGTVPGVWDGTGTWRSCSHNGWQLLDDRLGIELTCDNPENWHLPKGADSSTAGDVVRVVTSMANPSAPNTRFYLRLTTVIPGDKGISATASKRDASPMRFPVRRRIDARDNWVKQVAHVHSAYNSTGADYVVRDDTDKALAHAEALRAASEMPPTAGSVRAPWVAYGVGVGDLISSIAGREIDLNLSAGGPAGESPQYPYVVGVTWTCQLPQSTTWKVTDRRSEIEDANHGFGRSR